MCHTGSQASARLYEAVFDRCRDKGIKSATLPIGEIINEYVLLPVHGEKCPAGR